MAEPIVITVATAKGGSGKTTGAVHIAAGLALAGRRVLLADLDKQGHCATFLGRDPAPRLYDLLVRERELADLIAEVRPNLHLLAGNSETILAQDFARLRNSQADLLERMLVRKAVGYDYVVFDTPPQGLLQECAVYSADVIVVPVPVDFPGMDGAAQFLQVVRHLQAREHPAAAPKGFPPLGALFFVPMFVDLRTSESKLNLKQLQDRFGDQVLPAVPVRTRMREAIAEGRTIFEFAPTEDIAAIYTAICRTLTEVAHG